MSDLAKPAASPDLLSELLSAFSKLPPKEPKAKGKRAQRPAASPLPLPQAYAQRKTGYCVWKAIGRMIQLQKQICKCCGDELTAVKAEYFILENGSAHATWLRPEGYGIEHTEDLPFEYVELEPIYVSACAGCLLSPLNDIELALFPKQLSLLL